MPNTTAKPTKVKRVPVKKTKKISLGDRYNDMNTTDKHKLFMSMTDTLGYSRATIYRYLGTNAIPGKLDQQAIAKYFKVTVPEIF